jgi:ATP-dependent DNA helicase RecG
MTALKHISCLQLRGVGAAVAERLQKLGIISVQDLLFHLPFRYEDRTHITPLSQVVSGERVLIEGKVTQVHSRYSGKGVVFLCRLEEIGYKTGYIHLRFFHLTKPQREALTCSENRLRCFGEVRVIQKGKNTILEMNHPEYTILTPEKYLPLDDCLTPVYPTTEGLSQTKLRQLLEQALALLQENPSGLTEYLPSEIRKKWFFPDIYTAIQSIHRPPADVSIIQLTTGAYPAQQRLAFEELLAHQLSLCQLRQMVRNKSAPVFNKVDELTEKFMANLPFSLTQAQKNVLEEINRDLENNQPMMRLLQGDVGSGKTVVAAYTVVRAISSGYQAAVMAPTELLAEQHYRNFQSWLKPLGVQVILLKGGLKTVQRRESLHQIQNGEAKVVIGTHALFQKNVIFNRLGLTIIDEQHRFGVEQRLALIAKGEKDQSCPHQLVMTATPIPRTLAMTAYADWDCSMIRELPPGRTPVQTLLISDSRRHEVITRIEQACRSGQQAYWVCTLIEESEGLQCEAAEATFLNLKRFLPGLRLGLIHGKLNSVEKEARMMAFKSGEIDLLVATTVIEVGVDVPNATVLIIENAERLGLAQLHQLRGRVGRGSLSSYCVLMHKNPLSIMSKQRLHALRHIHDGFVIAQYDLEWRGPGEVSGTRQTGLTTFRVADLVRDKDLLPVVQEAAKKILKDHPSNVQSLIERWAVKNKLYMNV